MTGLGVGGHLRRALGGPSELKCGVPSEKSVGGHLS